MFLTMPAGVPVSEEDVGRLVNMVGALLALGIEDADDQVVDARMLDALHDKVQGRQRIAEDYDRKDVRERRAQDCGRRRGHRYSRRDLAVDRYDNMSPVIEQMLNLPVSEMLAMSIDQLLERIHPDDRGTVAAELKRSGSVGIGNVIYRFMAVDGSYRWLSNRFTVIRAADGRVLSSGVVRDVTESMQYNEALRKANEKLERSNEELQELAYVASHDLQEPLRTASFFADLLARDASCNLDERGREHLRLILDGTARMRELIDDLPESSRVGTAGQSFAPVDMNEVADRALRVLRSSIAESGVEIVVNELPTVNGDRAQLIHLMQNLLSNAVKFHSERPPRVEISSRNVDGEIVFSVRDNGIGIDMKHADRLFKMFSRLHTRDEYPGTGMGLAIAKRIVERHGGAYGSRACRARARRSTSPFHHEPARQARREGDVAAISLHIADRPTR